MASLYITGFTQNPDGSLTLHTKNLDTEEPQDITVDKEVSAKIQEVNEMIYDVLGNGIGIRPKTKIPLVDIASLKVECSKLAPITFKDLEAHYGK